MLTMHATGLLIVRSSMELTSAIFILVRLYYRENPENIMRDHHFIEQQHIIMEEARGKMKCARAEQCHVSTNHQQTHMAGTAQC
jgi:hypothetical protein